MKLPPRKLLLSGVGWALAAAATLSLPACTDTGYYGSPTTTYDSSYYRVGGRYYHCHRGSGICHNVRHPDYYWSGGVYRPRPIHRYYRPPPPPPRPRPL